MLFSWKSITLLCKDRISVAVPVSVLSEMQPLCLALILHNVFAGDEGKSLRTSEYVLDPCNNERWLPADLFSRPFLPTTSWAHQFSPSSTTQYDPNCRQAQIFWAEDSMHQSLYGQDAQRSDPSACCFMATSLWDLKDPTAVLEQVMLPASSVHLPM